MTKQHSDTRWYMLVLNLAKRIYKPILLAAFIAALVIYFLNNQSDLAALQNINVLYIALVATLQVLILAVNAWMFKALCSVYERKLPIHEAFAVTVKSSMVNFFGFMQGGTGYKAIYLKHKYKLAYKKFIVLQAANYSIIFAISSIIAVLALLIRWYGGLAIDYPTLILFLVIATTSTCLILLKKRLRIKARRGVTNAINTALEGWHMLVTNKGVIRHLFAAAILQSLLMSALFYAELKAVGFDPDVSGILIYSGLANIAIVLAITPAAIGFREAILIFTQTSLGVGTSAILLSSTVDRVVYFFLLVIAAVALYKPLQKIISRTNNGTRP